jgi:hypothetical protein
MAPVASAYRVGHSVRCGHDHGCFSDTYDSGCTCSALLRADKTSATALISVSLTSFPLLRMLVNYVVYRLNPLNSLRPILANAPKPPVAPIAAVANGKSVASVPVSVGDWPMPNGVPTMPSA